MTKFYGSKVGAIKVATPPRQIPSTLENGTDHVLVRDTIELATAAADTVQAAIVGWETVLNPYQSDVSFDDLGAGAVTLSFGDITFPNALINATDVNTAAGTVKALKTVDIANYFLPLWQQLGYASLAAAKLIGDNCELLFKLNAAAGAGTLTWQLIGQKRGA